MSDVAQTNTRNACDRSTEQPGLKQPLISAAGGGSQQHSRFTVSHGSALGKVVASGGVFSWPWRCSGHTPTRVRGEGLVVCSMDSRYHHLSRLILQTLKG